MLVLFAFMVHNYSNIVMAMLLAFCWGIVIGPIFIASNTVVHLVVEEGMRGQVFSALEIVIHFAFLVAMLLSSWISEIVSPLTVLIAVGVMITLIGLFGFLKAQRGGFAFSRQDMA